MPKKFPQQNSKAVEANARKSAAKAAKQDAEEKAKEDAFWADDDKHVKKKEERKQARDQKKVDKLEKKQENSRLLEDEESKIGGKQTNQSTSSSSKMTRHEIMLANQKSNESAAFGGDDPPIVLSASTSRTGDVNEDDERDLIPNMNREFGINDSGARNVDEAIAQLTVGDAGPAADQHPEKRMKAALKSYEKSRLPGLKGEQPGLRLSQYKEIIWKEFQKSPQNPLNQWFVLLMKLIC